MIVRETADFFICYQQADHALISGAAAKAWKKELLPSRELFEDACDAIEHHDDGWIVPDSMPVWNDVLKQPMNFIHYPLPLKLHFYDHGIQSLDNDYAKLLCSLHYASFFLHAQGHAEKEFYMNEMLRQNMIRENYEFDPKLTDYHFRMLQFCDDLSLFICMHEPGTKPADYMEWFKNGFRHSEVLLGKNKKIEIEWKNESDIELKNSPVRHQISVLLPHKRLDKKQCAEQGLAETWKLTATAHSTFTIQ